MSEESFKKLFSQSPIRRSKFAGIKRNLKFLQSP
jgi:epoxyqueuosine reductase